MGDYINIYLRGYIIILIKQAIISYGINAKKGIFYNLDYNSTGLGSETICGESEKCKIYKNSSHRFCRTIWT